MRRQHVVIGRHHADVRHGIQRLLQLVVVRRGRDDVGVVGARQLLAARLGRAIALGAIHESAAQILAALHDAFGDFGEDGMQGGHDSLLWRPDEFDGCRTLGEECADRGRIGIRRLAGGFQHVELGLAGDEENDPARIVDRRNA